MKPYATKANARRAAKKELTNTVDKTPVEGVDFEIVPMEDKFRWRRVQVAPKAPAAEAQAKLPEPPKVQPAAGNINLTKKQLKLVQRIEKYLGLELVPHCYKVKNNVITLETDKLAQHELHAIENYGTQFSLYGTTPGGHKKISLVMKVAQAEPVPAPKPKPTPEQLFTAQRAPTLKECIEHGHKVKQAVFDKETAPKAEGLTSEAKVPVKEKGDKPVTGTPRRKGAVREVWDICEENKGLARKDVIAICVGKGINFYTARTQYQAWKQASDNSK